MPSKTPKQHRFMEAVAHGFQPTGRYVSPKVAREFVAADANKPRRPDGRLEKLKGRY